MDIGHGDVTYKEETYRIDIDGDQFKVLNKRTNQFVIVEEWSNEFADRATQIIATVKRLHHEIHFFDVPTENVLEIVAATLRNESIWDGR